MRFLGFLIAAVFAFSITSVTSVDAAKKRSKRQTIKLSKKFKRYKSGIKFLKFSQVAKLPHHARVKYIKEFRSVFKDIEDIQVAFNPKKKKSKKNAQYRSILFGNDAFAEGKEHTRGASCADQCIYAYSLQEYDKPGGQCKRFPFGCSKPNRCYRGGSYSGYSCDVVASGLKMHHDGACFKSSQSLGSTGHCENVRMTLSQENSRKIQEVVASAMSNFGFDNEEVDPAFLQKDEAKDIISNLIEHMYDDHAYAMLVAIQHLYNEAGEPLPVDDSRCNRLSDNKPNAATPSKKEVCMSQYAEVRTQFSKKFDRMIDGLDDVFVDYMDMCREPIERNEVHAIVNLTNAPEGSRNRQLEMARRDNLKQVLGYRRTDTVSNEVLMEKAVERMGQLQRSDAATRERQDVNSFTVLQKPECLIVKRRLNGIRSHMDHLADNFPILRDDAPPGNIPPVEAPLPDSANPVGCSGGGELRNSLIFNTAARCTLCSVEKSVNNIGGGGVDDEYAEIPASGRVPQTGEFIPSKKWQSLMGIMMRACGASNASHSDIKQMMEFTQTFGSCGTEVYDWDTSDTFLQHGDITRIEKWSTTNYWNGEGKDPLVKNRLFGLIKGKPIPHPDMPMDGSTDASEPGHFARIFGLSYRQATEIFCDKSVFESEGFHVEQKDNGHQKIKHGQARVEKRARRKIIKEYEKAYEKCKDEPARERAGCREREQNKRDRRLSGIMESTPLERRNRGLDRLKYANENHYISRNNPDRLKSVAKNLESCMGEAHRRAEGQFDPDDPNAQCMGVVKLDERTLQRDMESEYPPGNVIVRDKGCYVSHQSEKHGDNASNAKTSLAFKDIDIDYSEDSGAMGTTEFYNDREARADRDFVKKTLKKYPAAAAKRGPLSIDVYYSPDSISPGTGNDRKAIGVDEMTVQMSCSAYWAGTGSGRSSTNRRGNQ